MKRSCLLGDTAIRRGFRGVSWFAGLDWERQWRFLWSLQFSLRHRLQPQVVCQQVSLAVRQFSVARDSVAEGCAWARRKLPAPSGTVGKGQALPPLQDGARRN